MICGPLKATNVISDVKYTVVFHVLYRYLLWLLILGMVVQGMFISCIIGVFGEMSRIATRMGMPDDTATQGILSGVWSSSFSLG